MKRITILFIGLLALYINTNANPHRNYDNLASLIQDYVMISKWDAVNSIWVNSTKQVAVYNDQNKLIHSIVLDAHSNDTISRISYYYNEAGLLNQQRSQVIESGIWIDKYKLITEYDDEGRRSSIVTYTWTNNEWILAARQHYLMYNEDNKLISYYSQYRINNEWESTAVDYYEYDSLSNLVYQVRKDMNGIFSYQAFYTYLNRNLLTRFVQNWQRSTNTWVNNYRDTYQYNTCGTRMQYIRERFTGDKWTNEQKTEYFYKIAFHNDIKNGKIAVCHNGNTIHISVNALSAHLAHGDCIGECIEERNASSQKFNDLTKEGNKPKFTVFPNPAREMVTIKIDTKETNEEIKRLELTDFYGKTIKIFYLKDQSEMNIFRGNLIPGKYFVKLIGDQIYSQMVIFE